MKERRIQNKKKYDRSENKEEILLLRQHNQDLLTQIKNLKHDKKSLQEEIDHKTSLVDKELIQTQSTLQLKRMQIQIMLIGLQMLKQKQARGMKKTQFQKLIKKKLQVDEVKIKLQGVEIM